MLMELAVKTATSALVQKAFDAVGDSGDTSRIENSISSLDTRDLDSAIEKGLNKIDDTTSMYDMLPREEDSKLDTVISKLETLERNTETVNKNVSYLASLYPELVGAGAVGAASAVRRDDNSGILLSILAAVTTVGTSIGELGSTIFNAITNVPTKIQDLWHTFKYGDMDTDITKFSNRADIINAKEAELKELEALRDAKTTEKAELDQQLQENLLFNAGINLVEDSIVNPSVDPYFMDDEQLAEYQATITNGKTNLTDDELNTLKIMFSPILEEEGIVIDTFTDISKFNDLFTRFKIRYSGDPSLDLLTQLEGRSLEELRYLFGDPDWMSQMGTSNLLTQELSDLDTEINKGYRQIEEFINNQTPVVLGSMKEDLLRAGFSGELLTKLSKAGITPDQFSQVLSLLSSGDAQGAKDLVVKSGFLGFGKKTIGDYLSDEELDKLTDMWDRVSKDILESKETKLSEIELERAGLTLESSGGDYAKYWLENALKYESTDYAKSIINSTENGQALLDAYLSGDVKLATSEGDVLPSTTEALYSALRDTSTPYYAIVDSDLISASSLFSGYPNIVNNISTDYNDADSWRSNAEYALNQVDLSPEALTAIAEMSAEMYTSLLNNIIANLDADYSRLGAIIGEFLTEQATRDALISNYGGVY